MTLTPSRIEVERRAIALVERLLARPGDEAFRRRLLRNEPKDVVARVERLQSASAGVNQMPTELPGGLADEAPGAPERFGPFRLVALIGRGGMGDVWRGVRDDGLYEQTVAVKLIQPHLQVRGGEAFENERRILAKLEHPNIARLIDGGATHDGRACLVMEFVDGARLDEACAALPLNERIGIFIQAAAAVRYAHARLVAHGDLKPGNILVDHDGRVRLLDFGIARLVADDADDAAPSAVRGAATSGFVSPQRLAGEPASIPDDLFALGQILRLIAAGIAKGDLAAVIAKATAPDEAARYADVSALLADLDRWRGGFPVTALAPSWTYLTRKYLRRNWIRVGAVAALVLITLFASYSYLRGEQQRRLAEARFDEIHSMAEYIINDVDAQLAKLPGAVQVRRQLVSRSHGYLQAMEKDRAASPSLQLDVAAGYLSLARIYGLDVSGGVGDLPAARESLRRANDIIASVAAHHPDDPRLLLLKARAQMASGSEVFVAPNASILKRSLTALQSAQALFGDYLKLRPSDIDAQLGLWRAQIMSGRVYFYLDQKPRSIGVSTENLYKARLPVHTHNQEVERDYLANGSYLMLGDAYTATNPREGHRYYGLLTENVDAMRRRGEANLDNDFIQGSGFAGMGTASEKLGELDRAAREYEMSISIMQHLLGFGPNYEIRRNLIAHQRRLAVVYSRIGRNEDAQRLSGTTIVEAQADVAGAEATGPRQRLLALALQAGAAVEHRAGNRPAACALEQRATQAWRVTQDAGVMLSMDLINGGPIKALRAAAARDCAPRGSRPPVGTQ